MPGLVSLSLQLSPHNFIITKFLQLINECAADAEGAPAHLHTHTIIWFMRLVRHFGIGCLHGTWGTTCLFMIFTKQRQQMSCGSDTHTHTHKSSSQQFRLIIWWASAASVASPPPSLLSRLCSWGGGRSAVGPLGFSYGECAMMDRWIGLV